MYIAMINHLHQSIDTLLQEGKIAREVHVHVHDPSIYN